MTDKVVDITRPQVRLRAASGRQRHCRHQRVVAVAAKRMLQCDDCAAWVDPFEWVESVAKREIFWRQQSEKRQRECDEAIRLYQATVAAMRILRNIEKPKGEKTS